ncbi:MAG: mannose-6-phosphate isomerase, class I [Chitinophagaceae bacterium]|nr:mannose-6-phosphate isomerase, class I [Chitinophagaceae bacterium]
MPGIYRLKGTVKHYDWGGTAYIPSLLKTVNSGNKPFAEYWMGTHPLGISIVETANGQSKKLTEYINDLPYLFKILDVKDMLSIQVHPSKADAVIEFARENKEGIPLDSPQRSYKDDNHKPELMAALGDFWLLHGFKPAKELEYILLNVVELRELLPVYNHSGYAGLYRHVMEMPQSEVDRILRPLLDNIIPLYQEGTLDKTDEDFWAARAALTFSQGEHIDRGIFSVYLFNLVHLKKGEAIFQDAGVPHAYLEGQNVEIMANSDNVLRGGLTTKYIDVKELLKHVKCEPLVPHILKGENYSPQIRVYQTPVKDFELSALDTGPQEPIKITAGTTEILIITEGKAVIGDAGIVLEAGDPAAVILPGTEYSVTGIDKKSTIFRASVPH